MKNKIVAILLLSLSIGQYSHAAHLWVTCTGELSGGSLVKKISIGKGYGGYSVKTYDSKGEIIDSIRSIITEDTALTTRYEYSLSSKYEIVSIDIADKANLGVVVYRNVVPGSNHPKVLVDFLECETGN